jgi:hypothetical protein
MDERSASHAIRQPRLISHEERTKKLSFDGGKQSEAQVAWAERFTKAGGKYILARSWDDVEKHLPS